MIKSYPITDSALRWIEDILSERFGYKWIIIKSNGSLSLKLENVDGAILFDCLCDSFYQAHSNQPIAIWYPNSEGIHSVIGDNLPAPGVTDLPSPLIEYSGELTTVHYDILGLTYWMLARIEEIDRSDLDSHGRFPAVNSNAYKNDYLNRPIIDEWLQVLSQVIQRQWPSLIIRQHKFCVKVSHDVDRPSRYGFISPLTMARRIGGDILMGNIKSPLSALRIRKNIKNELHSVDPFNTFSWIMDQSEDYGLTSAFYFICGHTSSLDGDYDIEHKAIRNLLRQIHDRGHEIGLHPSYHTFKNPDQLKKEAIRLKRVCKEEGIYQKHWGGRMHYLRWCHPETLNAWNDAGMTYDSTLTYADHAGFRCGTCFEYPGFDVRASKALNVRIRPLVAMETSVLSEKYMNLDKQLAIQVFENLKCNCRLVNGVFSLLWHNSELNQKGHNREIYKRLLLK